MNELKISGEIAAVYTDIENPERFSVGYIVALTEEQMLMLHIGLHGEMDGYSVNNLDDVYRIETDSKYINKIKALCSFNPDEAFKIAITDNLLTDLLNAAVTRRCIADVDLIGDRVIGYVEKVVEGKVYMEQIDDYGEYDGHTVFLCSDICAASIEDTECKVIDMLYKRNKK